MKNELIHQGVIMSKQVCGKYVVEQMVAPVAVSRRIDKMATEIAAVYREQPFVLLALMNGAIFMASRLLTVLTELQADVTLESVRFASYKGREQNEISVLGFAREAFEGKHVLVVDEIFDSGRTVGYVRKLLSDVGAASVKVAVLVTRHPLAADAIQAETPKPEFSGYEYRDNRFLVGSGMDLDGFGRGLGGIWEVCGEYQDTVTLKERK
jgi:hypoxanthine phosphoribosyltransferase